MAEKKKIHYAWFILAGCCALTFGMGSLINTGGQWFVSVTEELGCGTAQLALYFTVQGLCMAAAAPLVGKFLPKLNVRVLLTVCYALCILAVAAMSQYTQVWMWYLSGAVLGFAGCFVFLMPAPIILGQWFAKKNGFAVGLAMMFSGIGGAIFNPLAATLIGTVGWRAAYLIVAGVTAVVVLPFTIFVLRFKPSDMGLKPYGYEEASSSGDAQVHAQALSSGVPAQKARRSPSFWMLFLVCGLFAFTASYLQVLPQYASSVGMVAIVGLVSTMCMVGNIVAKLVMGAVSDKFGAKFASNATAVLSIAGFLMLIFCGSNPAIALAGAFLYGMSGCLTAVMAPLLTRAAFGGKDYANIYGTMSLGLSLVGAFGTTLVGLFYDLAGSYVPAFWLGIGICAAIILLVSLALTIAKRLPRES